MIKAAKFHNFKVLRDATLPLERFTLIVGPNGSGKSTALQALEGILRKSLPPRSVMTAGVPIGEETYAEVQIEWDTPFRNIVTIKRWDPSSNNQAHNHFRIANNSKPPAPDHLKVQLDTLLARIRVFAFHAHSIALPVRLLPNMELADDGSNLAGVLDRLRDQAPEKFEALNEELSRWLPEFDHILFETPSEGVRKFLLRTRKDELKIPAEDLSQGTLLALAMLTITHLPDPPPIIGIEEPDRGIHPRLLREVRDALYRLTYPEAYGEKRDPVQVIATTHSPYMLDLFRDHPEEIVIAAKAGSEARFHRLIDRPDVEEILRDTPLGEAWYSGILGGVPQEQR